MADAEAFDPPKPVVRRAGLAPEGRNFCEACRAELRPSGSSGGGQQFPRPIALVQGVSGVTAEGYGERAARKGYTPGDDPRRNRPRAVGRWYRPRSPGIAATRTRWRLAHSQDAAGTRSSRRRMRRRIHLSHVDEASKSAAQAPWACCRRSAPGGDELGGALAARVQMAAQQALLACRPKRHERESTVRRSSPRH